MLSVLRKHAASVIIKVILALIIIVFVFWGFEGFRADRSGRVASVDGESITIEEYRQAYNNLLEQYRQQFGGQINEELLEMFQLRQQAMDMLINQRVMEIEAKRLNFRVSDQELADYIRSVEAFQNNGFFDNQRYLQILRRIRTTPEQFEQQQRQALLTQKIREFVIGHVKVSDDEIMDFYRWNNTSVKIKYVVFDPLKYEVNDPDEESLRGFFEENQEAFRLKPMHKVQYVRISPEDFAEKFEPSDQEIKQFYEDHPDEFTTEETVEARHILIRVDRDAEQKVVEEKQAEITEILGKARSGEDFAELASQYSQGPTRDEGGYLGTFPRGSMVRKFEDAAFSLKPGEISDPVLTQFGWHIIKVLNVHEAKIQDFEEVKEQIRNRLVESHSRERANEIAGDVYHDSFGADDLAEVAQRYGVEIKITDFFSDPTDLGDSISDTRKFADIAFSLSDMEISDLITLADGSYIMQLLDRRESRIPDFEEVKEEVKNKWIFEKQNEMAMEAASAFLEKITSGALMEDIAGEYQVVVSESDFFKRNQPVADLGNDMQVSGVAFGLSHEKKYPDTVLRGEKGFYVIAFQERREPAAENFEQEKDNIRQRLMIQKQTKIFGDWIQQIRNKSNIWINNEIITG